jgi:hypothetical protein
MRKTSLSFVLRSAVVQALAVAACGTSWAACGGAIESLGNEGDAGSSSDGDRQPDAIVEPDGEVPFDAGHPHDANVFDTSTFDVITNPGDSSPPQDSSFPTDSACYPLAQPSQCAQVPYSCLPPGLMVGYNQSTACVPECGAMNFGCSVNVDPGGNVSVTCLCGGGRFPAGLALVQEAGGDPLGRVLARNAALEAAAVRAFEQLARELESHGAPTELVARARRAARQEVTHARLLRRAAEVRGCAVPVAQEARAPEGHVRSLLAIARENAVEGCGREALGAALLELQSRTCSDRDLRRVLARIARDEMGHAQLSWDLHCWLLSRLDDAGRAEVRAAHEAFLAACVDQPPPEHADRRVARALGVPSRPRWTALVAAVRDGLRVVGVEASAA